MILPDFFKSYSPTPSSQKKTADFIGGLFCYVHPLSKADITYKFTVHKAKITSEETEFSFFQIYPIIILTFGVRKYYA